MNLMFVSLYILWLSIFVSPTAGRSDSQDSADSSATECSDTDVEQSSEETKKPKRPYKNQGPQFDLTGNLRKRFAYENSHVVQTVACSPISALMSLGKLAIGAEGKTATNIRKFIGIPNKSKIKKTIQNIIHELKNLPGVTINVASRIFVSDKVNLEKKFKQQVKEIFKTTLKKIDFQNLKETSEQINTWVAEETGKLTEVNVDYSVSAIGSVVLVNIVTFVGNWEKKFCKVTTEDFHAPTCIKPVSMMHDRSTYNYVKCDALKAQVIEIPYESGKASFVVVLPVAKTGLQSMMKKLKQSPELLNDAMKSMTTEDIVLSLPKFKIQYKQDLWSIYKLAGLNITDGNKTGLCGIVKNKELHYADLFQVTVIDVNEMGTEAAAESDVETASISKSKNQIVFNADHPFWFFVKSTKEQIFAGVYAG